MVLDKGQRDDWFSSSFITTLAILSVALLVGFVFRELSNKYPIVNLHLLRNSNFAVSNLLMLTLGAPLYGSTVLIRFFCKPKWATRRRRQERFYRLAGF